MTEPEHDPPTLDELLLLHAAGCLPKPVSLAIGIHLELSPAARARHVLYEALGGALLQSLPPAPMAADAWERMAARLDEPEPGRRRLAAETHDRLAELLRRHLGVDLRTLCWRRSSDVYTADLDLGDERHAVWLLRIPAGAMVPRHGHAGLEIGVVLAGACRDERGRFQCGDVFLADSGVSHAPASDSDTDCMCLMIMRSDPIGAEAGT